MREAVKYVSQKITNQKAERIDVIGPDESMYNCNTKLD